MMSYQQKEVFNRIINTVQQSFPEVRLLNVAELKADSYWVTLTEPSQEDEELQMVELLGQLSTDALVDYGFDFQFVPISSEN